MINIGLLCVLLFMMTAATAEQRVRPTNGTSTSNPHDQKLTRREAIILDSSPIDSNHYRRQSQVIYRRLSRPKKYAHSSKPRNVKYVAPRPKYGPPKNLRRPPKKQRGKPIKPKYGPPKRRPSKIKMHGIKTHRKPAQYGPPKAPGSYIPQEPAGFGEPPSDRFVISDKRPTYGELPTDSYGAPIGPTPNQDSSYSSMRDTNSYSKYAPDPQDSFPPNQPSYSLNQQNSYSSFSQSFNPSPYSNYAPEPSYAPEPNYAASSHSQHSVGTNYAVPNDDIITASDASSMDIPVQGYNAEPYNPSHQEVNFNSKPQMSFVNHQSSYKPIRSKPKVKIPVNFANRPKNDYKKNSDEVIVGGQYAEPPARYVAKFKPSAPMYTGDDSFMPPGQISQDSTGSGSTQHSSYVNYKNSNMAFSPQNLNDAFSVPYN